MGKNLKANISLDKDTLKIKGKKNITIPLDPRGGWMWEDYNNDDVDVQHLYQIMQNNEDIIEQNKDE